MKYLLPLITFYLLLAPGSLLAQTANYFGGSKEVNDSVKTLFEAMEEPTFANRGNYFRTRQEFGKDSEQAKKMLKQMVLDDSLNLEKVIAVHQKYGWPLESQIGVVAVGQAFLQIQHGNFETQLKFLPVLKKAASRGEFTKSNLALIEDRVLTNKRKKQLYGTQYGVKLNKDGSKETLVWPIKSYPHVKKINNRREKMGLEKLVFTKSAYNAQAKVKDFR
ncbi:DUF6624 domain-containing protein [Adhaeribacter radiodurans]|uniref:Uncharacterized protein n=1 Tax=Adhaeribacter radiodurans TaxID=2745197 RepID=A0A7L7LFI1_9BACT|nr:DUF6624 domain-containing protein [Adhaeribacter radiodurans]QMU31139.1 hypothetical protein HUW48_25325 [Adhaeribacter radiodurans]